MKDTQETMIIHSPSTKTYFTWHYTAVVGLNTLPDIFASYMAVALQEMTRTTHKSHHMSSTLHPNALAFYPHHTAVFQAKVYVIPVEIHSKDIYVPS